MNDLFKKLNVLIKSRVNDALGTSGSSRRDMPPVDRGQPVKLGQEVDREIAALRERVNDALAYEDTYKARLRQLEGEIAALDQAADAALRQNNEDVARENLRKLQRAQRRYARVESDLQAHERATQELIERVNTLDAVVAEARRAQPDADTHAEAVSPTTTPSLADVLREARQTIMHLSDTITARGEVSAGQTVETPDVDAAGSTAVDDADRERELEADLARRRERLSKR